MSEKTEWAERIEGQLGDSDSPPPGTKAEHTTVTKADGWTVEVESGYSFGINQQAFRAFDVEFRAFDVEPPKSGDEITVHTHGTKVVGVDLRGQRLYLKSEREDELEWLLFRAKLRRERLEEFEQQRADLDKAYESLPAVLRARIDRFRDEDPEFRVEAEGYEMAAVADAPKIARGVWSSDEAGPDGYPTDLSEEVAGRLIQDFRDLPYEKQREIVPDLNEGHSGNTFGAATMLAHRLLTGQSC